MIRLHAAARPRELHVGGADADEVRIAATEALAARFGGPPVLELTSSCSSALEVAATVLGIGPGDEVVVPAFEFPTAATAFLSRGATLRFADVDPITGNVDPDDVERVLTDRTRAIVCLHYAGVAAEVERLVALGSDRRIDVVEDVAHALFASLDGTPLGRFGRVACLSLHATKNISVIDGGAFIANDDADASAIHVAVDKGTNRVDFERGVVSSYEWAGLGAAARMSEPAVRMLGPELDDADRRQARRHAVWSRYATELTAWADRTGVALPVVPAGRSHPAHLFHLVLPAASDRDPFVARCAAGGVETARHFGSLPESTFGQKVRHPDDTCPRSADLAARLVRIPLHQDLTDDDVDRVLEVVTG